MFKNFNKLLINAFVIVLSISAAVLADTDLELVAPGGGEADLRENVMKYYADGPNLVVVNWGNFKLETKFLEYQQGKSLLKANGSVKLTQKEPLRVLRCEQISADLTREHFQAEGSVKVKYDETTDISGELLEWESQTERFSLTREVVLNYAGWKMTGEKIEGDIKSDLFVVFGPVHAINEKNSMRAGRLIVDRVIEKITLQENPVVINGKNELSATEIVYDLKTKKVSASGVVKSRVIE